MLSVLLPARNAEGSLASSLESIAAQTFPDWECLVVDDRSEDRTGEIARGWIARDRRFRLLGTTGAGGIVEALEAARRAARAAILVRQDADDRSEPERFGRQLRALEADPSLAVLGCRIRAGCGLTDGMRRYLEWVGSCLDPGTCAREIWIESPIVHPTAMMRADPIAAAGGYRALDWPEDYDLWLRLHRAGERIASIPEALYEWNDPPRRLSRTDPRYAAEAFLRCKVHHLRRWIDRVGAGARPIVVWGAGRDGKRFARAWEVENALPGPPAGAIAGFVDIDPRKLGRTRRGHPVRPLAESIARVPGGFYIAAVGVPGARSLIRTSLAAAGLREPDDFVCVQ